MKNLHIAHGLFILILCYAYVFTFLCNGVRMSHCIKGYLT